MLRTMWGTERTRVLLVHGGKEAATLISLPTKHCTSIVASDAYQQAVVGQPAWVHSEYASRAPQNLTETN